MKLSRRVFLTASSAGVAAAAAAASFAGPSRQIALVYDERLEAGRRFARRAHGNALSPRAVEGDRIRFAQALLAERPDVIAGVTAGSDYLLLTDAARDEGFREVARLQHRTNGLVQVAQSDQRVDYRQHATMADNAWPELFADLLSGRAIEAGDLAHPMTQAPAPMISWVIERRDLV